jgi:ABC-type transport system involved in Fe-S cluster assembly fused permease/ATPase subunit
LKGRTSIVVAHRLSTVQNASRIFLIEGGRVGDHGSHEELLVHGGKYRELYLRDFR